MLKKAIITTTTATHATHVFFVDMPLQTRLDGLLSELLQDGKPQMLHFVIAQHPVQQKNVVASLMHLGKKHFVDVKEPTPTSSSARQAADWQTLSTKRLWLVCTFGTASNEDLMRQAAVQVLCSRTNAFCPHFRVVVLLTSFAEYESLPAICRVLSGLRSGFARVLDLGETADANPIVQQDANTGEWIDAGMRITNPPLEEWLDYTNVEDAVGGVAELQERIFNSDPEVTVVKYSTYYGRGAPYIRILRDALKFNIVVHTLDLTASECGDVVGACLGSILYTSRKLKTIILDSCSLTDAGVLHVAQAIRSNPHVRELTLSRNPSMTDASLVALASMFSVGTQSCLEALDISFNNIVYDVRFEWSPSALNTLWDALGQFQKLKRINLASCGLNQDHVLEAAGRWLSATNHHQGSTIKARGGDALVELSLAHNYLGDEVVATILRCLTGIRKLDLQHVQLGACGFRAVGFAIREWKLPLVELNLDANNASLERPFNDEIVLSSLRRTAVASQNCIKDGAPSPLRDTPKEDIPECEFGIVLPHRPHNEQPDNDDVVDEEGEAAAATDDDPTTAALLRTVSDTTLLGARYTIECLTGNTTLHSLSLSRSMIGDEAVVLLCDMIINNMCAVTHADISGNTNVEESSAHKIKELLVGGYFTNNDEEDDGRQKSSPVGAAVARRGTAENPIILSLNLSSNSTAIGERALLALYFNKGLRSLNIGNMALVDAMLLPLNEGMKQNPHLRIEELYVGRNRIWYDGVANIAAHLELSTTLRVLSLEHTWDAYDDEAGRPTRLSKSREEGLYYLSPLLKVLETKAETCPLEVLDLSHNDISPSCARGIAQSIAHNRHVRVVWLRDNPEVTLELLADIGDPRLLCAYPK